MVSWRYILLLFTAHSHAQRVTAVPKHGNAILVHVTQGLDELISVQVVAGKRDKAGCPVIREVNKHIVLPIEQMLTTGLQSAGSTATSICCTVLMHSSTVTPHMLSPRDRSSAPCRCHQRCLSCSATEPPGNWPGSQPRPKIHDERQHQQSCAT